MLLTACHMERVTTAEGHCSHVCLFAQATAAGGPGNHHCVVAAATAGGYDGTLRGLCRAAAVGLGLACVSMQAMQLVQGGRHVLITA